MIDVKVREDDVKDVPKVSRNCDKPNPFDRTNIFQKITYSYIFPLFRIGYKNSLTNENLYPIPHSLSTSVSLDNFEKIWSEELKLKTDTYTPSLTKVILSNSQNPLIETTLAQGLVWAFLMFLVEIVAAVSFPYYFNICGIAAIRTEIALQAFIFRKTVKLSTASRHIYNPGKVINLVSTDAGRISKFVKDVNFFWSVPFRVIMITIVLVIQIGASALVGVGLLLVLLPLQGYLFKLYENIREAIAPITDRRVKTMQEIVSGIRVIKFYSWETSFLKKVTDIRNLELSQIYRKNILSAFLFSVLICVPMLCSSISFIIYGLTEALRAEKIFPSLTLFANLRFPLMDLPETIISYASFKVGIRRISELLLAEEMDETANNLIKESTETLVSDFAIELNNADYSWVLPKSDLNSVDTKNGDSAVSDYDGVEAGESGTVFGLKSISIRIPHGSLVAVVGKVGSGKSSLLNALLGEMKKTSGSAILNGTLGYAPQQPWVQNASLKNNIIFHSTYEKDRYVSAIRVCSLEADIRGFEDGDQTELGEMGINLSGGQKQRVNLARCVYYNSDIVLMDDPLSAVDGNTSLIVNGFKAHVGKDLFENCIVKELAGKTRILVTHQLHFLPQVDYVIVMDRGEIREQGTYMELLELDGEFARLIGSYGGVEDNDSKAENSLDVIKNNLDENNRISGEVLKSDDADVAELMTKEDKAIGAVKQNVWMAFARNGGIWLSVVSCFILTIATATQVAKDLWLAFWTENRFPLIGQVGYVSTLVSIGILDSLINFVVGVIFTYICLNASRVFHDKALIKVLHAPVLFFDTTPMGRIINRFSKDIDGIDNTIFEVLRLFLSTLFGATGSLVLISVFTPWFLVPIIPLLALYYRIFFFYQPTSRELKRITSISRSPLFSHFGETMKGMVTIKAYQKQENFIQVCDEFLDTTNSPLFLLTCGLNWLNFSLNTVSSLIVLSSVIVAVFARNTISPAIIGLAISNALQVTSYLSFCVEMFSNTEIAMNEVERIHYYGTKIVPEAPKEIENTKPPKSWPLLGKLTVENLDIRYSESLPLILNQVSFSVQDKEKIGIVGRTGSGKSTIINALFRIMEPAGGRIIIDGIDISTIGLNDLRTRIAIIPQDPVIFQGDFRSNLDPFGEHEDPALWTALERSNLKSKVIEIGKGLDGEVNEGGANLSVGHRQLLCLARALLRNPKIIVLDEATASVDYETDAVIQQCLREDFKDATILTIAHRLNTIIDYDKVLVLEKGRVIEFDSPKALLSNPNGLFTSLIEETGPANADLLKSSAK
ncbi:Multidrug resistance-associated protein 1 [Lobulomyces angularis]|nr:Multidrug resistance-associated protein 1 [Lobulomyces angularis]